VATFRTPITRVLTNMADAPPNPPIKREGLKLKKKWARTNFLPKETEGCVKVFRLVREKRVGKTPVTCDESKV
jgi:hypothetical protein